jgi:hypothetical protein
MRFWYYVFLILETGILVSFIIGAFGVLVYGLVWCVAWLIEPALEFFGALLKALFNKD